MNNFIAARTSFGLLWICGVSLRLTVLSVPPVISLIQRDLNLSGTEIGLLSGMPVVVFAIFAAPGSIVVARMGVRGALVCGLLIAAAGTLLRIGAANAWQLYLTTMLMSVGIAIMQPSMAAAVREWAPERSAFGTAVYTNGLIMGEIIPVATMLPIRPALLQRKLASGVRCVGRAIDRGCADGCDLRSQVYHKRPPKSFRRLAAEME